MGKYNSVLVSFGIVILLVIAFIIMPLGSIIMLICAGFSMHNLLYLIWGFATLVLVLGILIWRKSSNYKTKVTELATDLTRLDKEYSKKVDTELSNNFPDIKNKLND